MLSTLARKSSLRLASRMVARALSSDAPTTFSHDKMETDKRYQGSQAVPDSLLQAAEASSEFSIRGQFREGRASYLDYSATTPLDPRVLDAMLPYMIGSFGNPHSRTHAFGWESERVTEVARGQIASLIGASSPKEIVFTSGATESNNMSIKGAAHFYKKTRQACHYHTNRTQVCPGFLSFSRTRRVRSYLSTRQTSDRTC